MGGGGGDNGDYERKQAQTEARKQAARNALNYQFGIGNDPGVYEEPAATGSFAGIPLASGADRAPNPGDFRTLLTTPQDQPHSDEGWGDQGGQYAPDEAGYQQAKTAYDAKQAEKAARATAINPNAGKRDILYQTVRDNAYTSGKRGLDEQRDEATRKLKFELFAKGLAGGSEDINQNALLGRTYSNGLLDLGGKADAAKAQFRGNDESTRLGLLQSIDAGMDQGSALSSAINQLQVNGDRAAAEAQGTTLGDLFANTALISNQSQYRQGKQAGTEWWNNYNPSSTRGSKAATGSITGV